MKQLHFDITLSIQGGGLLFHFAPDYTHQDLYLCLNPLLKCNVHTHIENLITIHELNQVGIRNIQYLATQRSERRIRVIL